ncbi:HigA protein (antitoxin to HigB) [Actinokineospora spheciospongiae]|uniref:HigA protein (Antitoxin to HigB) n=1 Tax=Actinokineospora spheciospongiae TaxID=909613 RepID=W7IBD3_9PSEU|nr:helix-turn-helix transcriptional regulator [Actinokineospora spheciospongiae]EWC58080.1 HigA protein (antitoxin to HigB) [Actinokineospora spheciospongiae]
MGHVENEVTPFLKSRRAALDPAALGLPDGPVRRRVRGLRREEVAARAGISVDYYTRIEQGRAPAISEAVLDAVARALCLTDTEHTYLRNITHPGRRAAIGVCRPVDLPPVRPQLRELLDALADHVPAVVYGPGTDLLAWNRLAARLAFDYDALPPAERNAALMLFRHPDARDFFPDWEQAAASTVSGLRAELGSLPEHGRVNQVVWGLRESSPDFRRLWDAQDVVDGPHGVKRINNPEVGELLLTFGAFNVPAEPGVRLCTYTAPKGSPTEERLRLLATGLTAGAV